MTEQEAKTQQREAFYNKVYKDLKFFITTSYFKGNPIPQSSEKLMGMIAADITIKLYPET